MQNTSDLRCVAAGDLSEQSSSRNDSTGGPRLSSAVQWSKT